MMPSVTPWPRRFRKLAVFAGTISSLYLLANYTFDRLRESRIRGMKDRQIKDRLKNHFTSLLSTISFTVYALFLPMAAQLSERYPVEITSQTLQAMSMSASTASTQTDAEQQATSESIQSDIGGSESELSTTDGSMSGAGESWASEYTSSLDASPNAAVSELPQTPSVDSRLVSARLPTYEASEPAASPKTKKELWADLKVQTISKALATAYMVPLLLLLASAQLSTLARIRYMADVKSSLPSESEAAGQRRVEDEEDETKPTKPAKPAGSGWLNYFSVEAMGLAEYVDGDTPGTFSSITNFFAGLRPHAGPKPDAQAKASPETEEERADAERLYLTYSWWLLHQGWQGIADRVDRAVELVFAKLPIKLELSVEDWQALFKEARALVETEIPEVESTRTLHDFTVHMLPPNPLTSLPPDCPLPTHPETSPYLMDLLAQTRQQLASPDARHVLDKGVTEMIKGLTENLGYTTDDSNPLPSQRLAACLPPLKRWDAGVWEEVPNMSVEGLLSKPDFESFVALIFGDWA